MISEEESYRNQSKSVLIIVENLPVPFDRRVWQEATALAEAGYTVSVICPKAKDCTESYEEIAGIHIYRHPLPLEANGALGYLLEYLAALFWEFALSWRVLRRHGFDVVHACNPPDLLFLIGWFYKTFLGKKFLFDHHDINPELYEAKFGKRGVFYRLLGFFERQTFRCADVSLATNDTFKAIAVERGGMSPERVWVVKSYPDLKRFHRVRPDPSLRCGRRYLLGYVGIIAAQDGVDLLLRAMAHIVKDQRREDVHCLVVGDGPELANLVALAEKLDIEAYVTFTGYLTGTDLLSHLCSVDIGVIPDPYNAYNDKISMNKVFEYMALGIPFVQFDLAESRLAAGEAALTARDHTAAGLGAAILELVEDPDKRQAMSAYGVAHAEKDFRWDKEKTKLLSAYEALLE